MLKQILIGTLLLLILPSRGSSQISNKDFQAVDNFARSVEYENSLEALTNKLTAPYIDTLDKLRAIFIWITDNIEYDYKLFNSGSDEWNNFNCRGTKAACDVARTEWENNLLLHVLDKRKAVCNGYAKLFKKMCSIAGIQNDVVGGYVRKSPFQIGLTLSVTHAWNVVRLGGVNYYFDVTWAAGSCKRDEETDKLSEFVKHYNDFYWQTPKSKFLRNHFPKEDKWALEPGYTKEYFFNAPYFYPNDLVQNIESNMPDSGVIRAGIGDTIHFKFVLKTAIRNVMVNTNNYENVEISLINAAGWTNNVYQFDYLVKENSLYYIEILFDFKKAIRYKVIH